MAMTETAARVLPYARGLADDDDLRDHLTRATQAARGAWRARGSAPPAKQSMLKRAGEAVREAGMALTAAGEVAEKREREQRRTTGLGVLTAGGALAAAAMAYQRRSAAMAARSEPEPLAPAVVTVTDPRSEQPEIING